MISLRAGVLPALTVAGALLSAPRVAAVAENFESAPVSPVALTPDGRHLLVTHVADHRLVVFALDQGQIPIRVGAIAVGLEPVSVVARTNDEVWVVNQISDSVSLIDLSSGVVIRTLPTGDEPADLVFTSAPERAVISIAQEDRLEVWDPNDLDAPPIRIPIEGERPRALGVSPDGRFVHVAALESGNRTTAVASDVVTSTLGLPPPSPSMDPLLPAAPEVALILRHGPGGWRDELGRNWDDQVPYAVIDADVCTVDPVAGTVQRTYSDVGTNLFGLVVGPASGRIHVTNQEARNEVRFEPNLRGRFVETRLTTIEPDARVVRPRSLNEHIDHSNPAGTDWERSRSLALPLDVAIRSDESALYVAAFGSRKVAVLAPDGAVLDRIEVGGGPAGLVLDEARDRLYVYNRFDSTVSVITLGSGAVLATLSLGTDPAPAGEIAGRPFLYDAAATSAHGDVACGTCHLFGGMDGLAWDLGDPQGAFLESEFDGLNGFHPMKGPMVTQTLKALPDTEPFHWRGDRLDLPAFNPAFVGLMGRSSELSSDEFALFQEFVFGLRFPPSPRRLLDLSLAPQPDTPGDPVAGEEVFTRLFTDGFASCNACHAPPTGEDPHVFEASSLLETQDLNVPQIRNLYERDDTAILEGRVRRGFAFGHDGTDRTIPDLLESPRFTLTPEDRENVAAFVLAFETGTHPAIGQQWTFGPVPTDDERIAQLLQLADESIVGLIAKGLDPLSVPRGWAYQPGGFWRSDRAGEAPLFHPNLEARADPAHPVTLTAVFVGAETRLGIDHDLDGFLDRDEIDAGSDPGDPTSWPADLSGVDGHGASLRLVLAPPAPNPASSGVRLRYVVGGGESFDLSILDPAGRRVRSLSGHGEPEGQHETFWDLEDQSGDRVPSGIYFIRLATAEGIRSERIVVRR